MNISYDYFKIFYYVCTTGSFTKAASALSNSQPNITRAMNNLESQLGFILFQRSKKGITLTNEGELLYKRVRIMQQQLNLAFEEIHNYQNMNAGVLTIGASEIALHEALLPIIPRFKEQHPNIILRITNETTPSAIKNLKEGLVDFAIVTTPIEEDDSLSYQNVMTFKESAVCSKELLNGKESIELKDLKNYPIIMMAPGTGTRAFYDDLFAHHNIKINPQIVASTINQIQPMVNAGLGIGFVSENMQQLDPKTIKLSIPNLNIERSICIVRRKDRAESISSKALIEELLSKH